MSKNSKYWESRIANNTWSIYNSLEEKNKAILEMYQEAYYHLSEELYRVAEKINGGKPNLTDMHKHNRLSLLKKKFEDIIEELVDNVESLTKEAMFKAFSDNYKNIMKSLDLGDFAEVNQALMEELLEKPWQGSFFSKRLWKNTSILASNLNEFLTQGLIQGKTIAEISIGLGNLMQQGFNVTHRLVRTEAMHYLNQSSHRAYEDAGIEKVQVWAAKDERTCKVCGKKHGKIYFVDKSPILPLHSNCRCTYIPIVD
ncbi:minor capsid protein [Clostridium cylindrosporum]|uniref:Phage putative head morphogenesis protein, SPP1 gp7 family n=1 Tax=Clostridium cylindrosporum DSM 605 TaxID=1121307 RepID=A0A0J8D664_CLOCY|nr:minor capsid protein [Clostridium cylindrosporum]KMT21585.1 phage putative head morphogenesis protein, SPP1 gp7 family [Clostridium cylindrosporum DSM 605]